MSHEEREQHDALMDIADPFDNDDGDYEADFLSGNIAADLSHAGEGIQQEEVDLADEELVRMLKEHQRYVLKIS
jgi:hypothetical protein